MLKKALIVLAVVGIGVGSVVGYGYTQRSDCPGMKTCPLTAQPVCAGSIGPRRWPVGCSRGSGMKVTADSS